MNEEVTYEKTIQALKLQQEIITSLELFVYTLDQMQRMNEIINE